MRVVEFNDYVQPNFALAQGALDANAFQHVVYLKNFAAKNKLELSELVKVPTRRSPSTAGNTRAWTPRPRA